MFNSCFNYWYSFNSKIKSYKGLFKVFKAFQNYGLLNQNLRKFTQVSIFCILIKVL